MRDCSDCQLLAYGATPHYDRPCGVVVWTKPCPPVAHRALPAREVGRGDPLWREVRDIALATLILLAACALGAGIARAGLWLGL